MAKSTFTHLLRVLLLTTALTLLAPTALAGSSGPNQCIAFDASWNLLAFNFDSKDSSIPSTSFTSSAGSATTTDITKTSGRPPFDQKSSPPLCYTSQFTNAIYVLNADASDPSSVYIFDATASSWSKQATTLPPTSATTLQGYNLNEGFQTILDRDTNVFYALTKGNLLMSLDMGLLKSANATALAWNEVQNPVWNADGGGQEGSGSGLQGYEFPTMALAQNHVHFVGGVPGLKEGEAKIFVIHYSYLQPLAQSYPSSSGSAFPTSHGRTASFFRDDSVQTQFAYVPDEGGAVHVVDVNANSTTPLPGPPTKDAYALYAASPTALVQLSSEGGKLAFITYDQEGHKGGEWSSVEGWKGASNTPETSGSAGGSGSGGSATGTGAGSASATGTKGVSSASENGAGTLRVAAGLLLGGLVAVLGALM